MRTLAQRRALVTAALCARDQAVRDIMLAVLRADRADRRPARASAPAGRAGPSREGLALLRADLAGLREQIAEARRSGRSSWADALLDAATRRQRLIKDVERELT